MGWLGNGEGTLKFRFLAFHGRGGLRHIAGGTPALQEDD
jgi:hypothetical protein